MIVETRQLVFSDAALLKVFRWYARAATQSDLPQGLVASIVVIESPLRVMVSVHRLGASRFDTIPFGESKIIGALIYFCKKQKIPVPRDAVKTLRVLDNFLVLDITRKLTTTAPP